MKSVVTFVRLIRTGLVLSRHDALIPKEYAQSVPWGVRMVGRFSRLFAKNNKDQNAGERLAHALENLGPAYIKFGQILATRTDMLEPEFVRGLSRLKDKVPAFSTQIAKQTLDKDLGQNWQSVFKTFSEPVAAASVAQVHKAELLSGEIVAVKILRPNIHEQMAKDLDVLRMVAGIAQKWVKSIERMRPKTFIETVARSVSLELDLRLEAAAASEIGETAQETGLFRTPKIYWSHVSKNVMVMEWIDGQALSSDDILTDPKIDRQKLAIRTIQSFLVGAFDYGVFHADMHEGNLIVDAAGELVLLDFGILGRLSPKERRFHAEILYGFLERDYLRIAEIHFEAGYVPAHHTLEDFASALRAVGEPIFGKTSNQVSMSKVLLQLFEITDIFDMQMQPQLIMLQKTMMQAEGVARRLDPEFDMWEASRPVVEASMRAELGPRAQITDLLGDLKRARKTLQALPEAGEEIAALAKAWRAGEIDLSRPIASKTEKNDRKVGPKIGWSLLGASLMLAGVWGLNQL